MPVKSFVDREGRRWEVWSTTPAKAALIARELAGGWLTFASGGVRRRLYPIPSGWEAASDERLDLMCRAAEAI